MVDAQQSLELARQFGAVASDIGSELMELPSLNAALTQFCRIAAGTPFGRTLGALDIPTVCTPFLDADGRTYGGAGDPPFTGGQCPGVTYSFNWQALSDGSQVASGNGVMGSGPLAIVNSTGPAGNPEARLTANGVQVQGASVSGSPGGSAEIVVTNISRPDGLPDNCGDPPSDFEPGVGYDGEEFDVPDTVTGPDGQDYEVTVREPTFDDRGNPTIDVDIDGIEFNFGPPGGGGAGSGFSPGPTVDGAPIFGRPSSGERGVPEVPSGAICVAVALVVSGFSPSVGKIIRSEPNIRRPLTYGNFAVKVRTDQGGEYWQDNIDLKSEKVVEAIAVEGLRIVGFRVTINPGLTYIATPIYRLDTQEE